MLGSVALIGVSLIAGMLLADEAAAPPAMIPIPIAVQIPAPAVAQAPINVTVAAPAPIVDEPRDVTYRATTPALDADCLGGLPSGDAVKPSCTWDSGFPAISADGTQIVEAIVPDDGGRGNPGLIVVFTEVATSKPVHSITVLDPDETEYGTPMSDQLRAKMTKRAAAAQRLIDAKKFRSLIDLGTHNAQSGDEINIPGDSAGIHAEYSGATMRLLDPATRSALWRHQFSVPSPYAKSDPDQECHAWYLAQLQTWWDPKDRVVLGRLLYHHGGCMCGSSSIPQVFKL